jgi:hypothetical protein
MWMSDQFQMFEQTTSEDTANVISSPESESGVTPCDSPDGLTSDQSGQEAAPVQVSQRAGKGGGFDDPRHLWPHWARLIRECHPASIFGEQVDAAIGHGWIDLVQVEMEAEEYAIGKASLNSAGYGGYDIRQRLYFVAHSQRDRRSGPWQHSEPMHPAENSYREAGGLFDAVRWGALPYVCRRHDRDPSGMVQMRGYGDAINPWVAKAFIEACNF